MPRIDDYKTAIALAVAELKEINPKRLENRTGAQHFFEAGQEGLIVPYFGQARRITWPEVSVTPGDGAGEISLPEQGLILHYLLNASGDPLTGQTIDFRQVPEGGFYWSAFVSRAKNPLLETFGQDLALYAEVAATLGENPCPWVMSQPGTWPFPGCPLPMSCGGETRNFLPRPPSCSMQPSPGICPPRTSPPSPAPRSTA